MPPDEIVGVAVRQASTQHLEALAAVAGARDDNFRVHWDAPLILDRRHEPSGVRVARMRRHGETELRWPDRGQLMPVGAPILRAEDAVVMLAPDDLGPGWTVRQPVDVLGDRIALQIWRHVFVVHALVDQ